MARPTKYTPSSITSYCAKNNITTRTQLRKTNNPMYQAGYKLNVLDKLFGPVDRSKAVKMGKAKAKITKTRKLVVTRPTAPRATVTSSMFDHYNMQFNFKLTLQNLNADEAQKLMLLVGEINDD